MTCTPGFVAQTVAADGFEAKGTDKTIGQALTLTRAGNQLESYRLAVDPAAAGGASH